MEGERGREPGSKEGGNYVRQEKRGLKVGFPRWQELGEIGEIFWKVVQYFETEKKAPKGGNHLGSGGNRE